MLAASWPTAARAIACVACAAAAAGHALAGGPPFIIAGQVEFRPSAVKFTDLAVDAAGNAYVAGTLASTDFPGIDAAAHANAGRGYRVVARYGRFAATPDYSAVVGWPQGPWQRQPGGWLDPDETTGLVVDGASNAYTVAYDVATNFPNIGAQYQRSVGSLYVFRVAPGGAVVRWSAALDPAIRRVAALGRDASGALYLTGTATSGLVTSPGAPYGAGAVASGCLAPYVLKLDATGRSVVYATYLGYSGTQGQVCGGKVPTPMAPQYIHPAGLALAVDAGGNAFVAGQAEPGFAATPGAVDFGTKAPGPYPFDTRIPAPASHAFVAKINAAGTGVVFNARIGGSLRDRATSLALDASGAIVVAGKTSSQDFPAYASTVLPVGGSLGSRCGLNTPELGFVARLSSDGARLIDTYLLPMDGGQLDDCGGATSSYAPAHVALDAAGNVLVAGLTDPQYRDVRATRDAIVPDPVGSETQSGNQVLFVVSADFQRLLYASVLPHYNVRGLALDARDHVVVAGDSQLARLVPGAIPVELAVLPSPACGGSPTTLRAAVAGAYDVGAVDFTVDGTSVGTVNVVSGIAAKSVTLPVGVRRIKATYRGASSFDGRSSLTLAIAVNQAGACQ
jgi:hypothetical protein